MLIFVGLRRFSLAVEQTNHPFSCWNYNNQRTQSTCSFKKKKIPHPPPPHSLHAWHLPSPLIYHHTHHSCAWVKPSPSPRNSTSLRTPNLGAAWLFMCREPSDFVTACHVYMEIWFRDIENGKSHNTLPILVKTRPSGMSHFQTLYQNSNIHHYIK